MKNGRRDIPMGLKREAIPTRKNSSAVETLTPSLRNRPSRRAMTTEEAIEPLIAQKGHQLRPPVVPPEVMEAAYLRLEVIRQLHETRGRAWICTENSSRNRRH